ncbi:unnamed protein product, partial [Laminaria digitata]
VKSTLFCKDWLWVGDRFLGSSRVAFEVPAAASSILSSVPTELREFRTLLHTLGVPERFRPGDYLAVLKTMEAQAKGRPLDPTALSVAVGLVKILAQLSAAERGSIEPGALLVPDESGPRLLPASSLVYDDAPWLSGRLRQLHLVHPDVGDEVSRKSSVPKDGIR